MLHTQSFTHLIVSENHQKLIVAKAALGLACKNTTEASIQLDLRNTRYLTPTILNGKIILVSYQLQVVIKMGKFRSPVSVILPVVIGTVGQSR